MLSSAVSIVVCDGQHGPLLVSHTLAVLSYSDLANRVQQSYYLILPAVVMCATRRLKWHAKQRATYRDADTRQQTQVTYGMLWCCT